MCIRDSQWLEPSLDILFTHRARAKVSEYFRVNNGDELTVPGRCLLLQQKRQLAIPGDDEAFVEACVAASPYNQSDRLLQAVASGEVSYIDLVVQVLGKPEWTRAVLPQVGIPGVESEPIVAATVIQVSADNRERLLSDITQLLAAEHLSLIGAAGRVSNSTSQAIITVEVELQDWQQMLRIINLISLLNSVTDVCRVVPTE